MSTKETQYITILEDERVNVGGKDYEIKAVVDSETTGGFVPVIELKQMSDLAWHKWGLKSREESPELFTAMGEDVEAVKERLRATIAEMEQDGIEYHSEAGKKAGVCLA